MKRFPLLSSVILALFLLNILNAQTTIPADAEISGTWGKAGSPYIIEGNVTIPRGQDLVIESGVHVQMKGWHMIKIRGGFQALGSEGDTVVFTTHHPDSTWLGLRFENPENMVELQYVIVENGFADYHDTEDYSEKCGSGLYGGGGAYHIEHSVFRNNEAVGSGGGIRFSGGKVTIDNSSICNNSANWGGGISIYDSYAEVSILNSNIHDNQALEKGGAIHCRYGTFAVYNCVISRNTGYVGGGIYYEYIRGWLQTRYPIVSESEFKENVVTAAGSAILASSNEAPVIFANNTFANNVILDDAFHSATVDFDFDNPPAYISNCTFSENQNYTCFTSMRSDVEIQNCIIRECGPLFSEYAKDLITVKYTNSDSYTGGYMNSSDDPEFVDVLNEDFSLAGTSPCIDAGNPWQIFNDKDGTRNDMGMSGGSGLISLTGNDTCDFGPAAAGDIYTIEIVNTRNETVILDAITFSDPEEFSCSLSFPLEVKPFETMKLPIEFHAVNEGDFAEELQLSSSDFSGTTALVYQLLGYSATAGEITGILTSAGSPYTVTGNIVIPAGDSLLIEPGVELIFEGHFHILVNGQLKALGSNTDSVVFKAGHPDMLWGGIRFVDTKRDNILRNVKISGATGAEGTNNAFDTYGAASCRNSKLLVEHSTITDVETERSAGIYGFRSQVVIQHTLFENNESNGDVLIEANRSSFLINNTTFRSNHSNVIKTDYSELILSNCLITGQTKNFSGSYIKLWNSEVLISNTVIYKNKDYGTVFDWYRSNIDVKNTIVGESGGLYMDYRETDRFKMSYSNIEGGYEGPGNIDVDPGFVDAVNGDFHLSPDSPCIDAGSPSAIYNDSDGSRSDMGLYGGTGLNVTPVPVNFHNTGLGQQKSITLKVYNQRETPFRISTVDITGDQNFTLSDQGSMQIESNSQDSVVISFNPDKAEEVSESLVLTSPDLNNADTAMISVLANAGPWEGEVSGVWTKAYSPYILGGSITVPDELTLTIQPGVQVQVDTVLAGTSAGFSIKGSLEARGTENDPIVFSSLQEGTGLWRGIIVENENIFMVEDESSFDHCVIEKAMNGIEIRSRGVDIHNCILRNNSKNGVYWNGGDLEINGIIENSVISGNGNYGIYCRAECYDRYAYCEPIIRKNEILHNASGGIDIFAAGSIPGGSTPKTLRSYCRPVIDGNLLSNNAGPAVNIYTRGDYSEGIPFKINRHANAIPLLRNNIMHHNLGVVNSYEGSFNSKVELTMINSTLWNNGDTAVNLIRGSMEMMNAIVWGDGNEAILGTEDSAIQVSFSNLKTSMAGDHNVSEDPMFIDPESGDFHIGCTSPCINAGNFETDTSGFPYDFYGNSRIYSGNIDMGAIENHEMPQADFDYTFFNTEITFQNTSEMAIDYSWDFGDGFGSNEESPVHQFASDGEYTVSLTATNECGEHQYSEDISIVSTYVDAVNSGGIRIFPNPSSAYLNIHVPGREGQQTDINIFNSSGNIVYAIRAKGYVTEKVNVSDYAPGIYLVILKSQESVSSVEVMIY